MAFEPKQWKYDDDVTEQELNRIEQGIVEANQKADQNTAAIVAHLNEKATQTKLGHVIVDNKTIKSTDGVISTKFRGALVYTTYFQAIPNEVVTKIAWTDVVNDTDSFFNPSNPTRLTIPSGVSKVVVKAHVVFLANATGRRYVSIIKNDSAAYNGRPSDLRMAVTDTNTSQVVVSGVIDVSTGDYFEVVVYQNSGVSLNLDRGIGNLWFSLEVIE